MLGTHHTAYPTGHGSSCWPGPGWAAWERCSCLLPLSFPCPPPAPAPPPASPTTPPSASKQILLELHLQHVGHTPGSKADMAMLPMDPRLRDFISPMATAGTPARFQQALVLEEGRKLSVVDGHTNVDTCNTRYFPTDRGISNQVRKASNCHTALHRRATATALL